MFLAYSTVLSQYQKSWLENAGAEWHKSLARDWPGIDKNLSVDFSLICPPTAYTLSLNCTAQPTKSGWNRSAPNPEDLDSMSTTTVLSYACCGETKGLC